MIRTALAFAAAVLGVVSIAGYAQAGKAADESRSHGVLTHADARLEITGEDAKLGWSVAGVGDVNGDGRDDVAAVAVDAGRAGRAYVVFGARRLRRVNLKALGRRGFLIDPAGVPVATRSRTRVVVAVAGAGDVNGDGRSDLIVGAPDAANNGRAFSGSSYVVFGKRSSGPIHLGALRGNGFRIDGASRSDGVGASVDGAGDMNGDGRSDVIVSDHGTGRDFITARSGSAYVVFGKSSPAPIDLAALGAGGFRIDGIAAAINTNANYDVAGIPVAGAGDVNGDGRPDVIIGAPDHAGGAYVVFGKPSSSPLAVGLLGSGGFRIDGAHPGDHAGSAVAEAGDVNGDGRGDVIVGAAEARQGKRRAGAAYVVFGKASVDAVSLAALGPRGFTISGIGGGGAGVGHSVSGGADLNRDGLADVVVGVPRYFDRKRKAAGMVAVVYGKSSNTPVDLARSGMGAVRIEVPRNPSFFGYSASVAGDVNGDRRADVIVGAPLSRFLKPPSRSWAFIFFGPFRARR